jgi:hypothetical protein
VVCFVEAKKAKTKKHECCQQERNYKIKLNDNNYKKYRVYFSGCNYDRIMSLGGLLQPHRRGPDSEPVHLCWSCLREEKGACSITPYKVVADVIELPPNITRTGAVRQEKNKKKKTMKKNHQNKIMSRKKQQTTARTIKIID